MHSNSAPRKSTSVLPENGPFGGSMDLRGTHDAMATVKMLGFLEVFMGLEPEFWREIMEGQFAKKQNSSFIVSFCMFVGEVFHPKVLCPTVVLFPTLFKGHNDGSSVGGWLHNVWNRQRLHQEVNTCTRWEGLSIKSELQYLDKITSLFFSHGVLTRCTFALLNLQLTLFECTNSFEMSHCLLWMFEAHPAAYMKFQSSKIPKPKGQEVNPS